jgi:hypothetical protein
MEAFAIDESRISLKNKIEKKPSINPPQEEENHYKKLFLDFIRSKYVKNFFYPFANESEACQRCFKIFACITLTIVFLIVYSLIRYG